MFQNRPPFQDLEWGNIFFVSSRVNGGGTAFLDSQDYAHFLKLVKQFLLPIADIYAYSLCPKTFDFLLCIKSKSQIYNLLRIDPEKDFSVEEQHELLLPYFENLVEHYADFYRKKYQTDKNLFGKFIKRIQLNEENELKETMREIHLKPQKTNEIENFSEWKFSSYQSYLSQGKSAVSRDFMLHFFSSEEEFITFHQELFKRT